MCGRMAVNIPDSELRKIFKLIESAASSRSHYNISPTQSVGVVRSGNDELNRYDYLRWGLVPGWAKEASIGTHMINARSETVAEKPSFRHGIKYRRCIVPVSGFYEWDRSVAKKKQPYFIRMANQPLMPLAGLWETWKSPEGDVLETFSILTTSANSLLGKIHDRMPVILSPDAFNFWLSPNMHDTSQLEPLYAPYNSDEMEMHKVSDQVNNSRYESPSCIEPQD